MNPLAQTLSPAHLSDAIRYAPWGYSFDLCPDFSTDSIDAGSLNSSIGAGRNDILLRLSMLSYILDHFQINGDWIDVASNCGIIPIMLTRGRDLKVTGSDFANINIEKAMLLQRICGDQKCTFEVKDAFDHLRSVSQGSVDLVSALGIFYHLSNPIELLQLMHSATRSYVLIDTIIHNFEFSGWIQTISRHLKYPELAHANDTRKIIELHPTYRGMIDALYQVGFTSVVEVLPSEELLVAFPDTIYHTRNRRMLLAKKA